MKTAIHFYKILRSLHGTPHLKIDDLRIYENEIVAFYGLTPEYSEMIVNQMTAAYLPDEGSVSVFGNDSRGIADEKSWFNFFESFGIYNAQPMFQEGASIGENVATLFRLRNEAIEEPQLSTKVLKLANLVQLTITDLSKMMNEATPELRMKVRFCRALAGDPKVLILCDPTEDASHEVSQKLVELIRRTRRKRRSTLILFTSDVWLLEQLADRVLFLNPAGGLYVENQLRQWYHKLFRFLHPSPGQLLQLSMDVLQHGRIMKDREERFQKQ